MKYCKWHEKLLKDYLDWLWVNQDLIFKAEEQIYSCSKRNEWKLIDPDEMFRITYNVMGELFAYERMKFDDDIKGKAVSSYFTKTNA